MENQQVPTSKKRPLNINHPNNIDDGSNNDNRNGPYSHSYKQQHQHNKKKQQQHNSLSSLSMNDRCIILFDLDCFYAQCYCIRYGYDVNTTTLALFQWNSVLAVTYPARKLYNIQRGDTWDIVNTKSNYQCLCVHVPISTINNDNTNNNVSTSTDHSTCHDDDKNNNNSSSSSNTHDQIDIDVDDKTTTTTIQNKINDELNHDITRSNPTTNTTTVDTNMNDDELQQNDTKPSIDCTSNTNVNNSIAVKDGNINNQKTKITTTRIITLHDEYQELFQLNTQQQVLVQQQELGIRKYSTQGKACIEIFRIASATILQIVRQCIDEYNHNNTNNNNNTSNQKNNNNNMVLERASIDEFFLDISNYVQQQLNCNNNDDDNTKNKISEAMKHTVIISSETNHQTSTTNTTNYGDEYEDDEYDNYHHDDDDTIKRLQYSCLIAYEIRQKVFNVLGFTMSAGIGHNKTIAKLAASYGKPNGQAVIYPYQVQSMLYNTPISKCRHLGGKVGKLVQNILVSIQECNNTNHNQDSNNNNNNNGIPMTLGSIVQYLSLPLLQQKLPNIEMAQKVYDLARGIDHEIVESKTPNDDASAILTKSITAFKSLNFNPSSSSTSTSTSSSTYEQQQKITGHTLQEAMVWIELLIKEIIPRVDRDTQRNERYPKGLIVQYYSPNDSKTPTKYSHQNNKSIRISFPSYQLSNNERIQLLLSIIPNTLKNKISNINNNYRFHRIGLCATDFESLKINHKGINTYFTVCTANNNATNKTNAILQQQQQQQQQDQPSTESKIMAEEEATTSIDVIATEAETESVKIQNDENTVTNDNVVNDMETTTHFTKSSDGIPSSHVVTNEQEILTNDISNDDYLIACKLQAAYDQEEQALHNIEKKRLLSNNNNNRKLSLTKRTNTSVNNVRTINNFFKTKKK